MLTRLESQRGILKEKGTGCTRVSTNLGLRYQGCVLSELVALLGSLQDRDASEVFEVLKLCSNCLNKMFLIF